MKQKRLVMKFGGKSLARQDANGNFLPNDLSLFREVARFIFEVLKRNLGLKIVAVVSAKGNETDRILKNTELLFPGENRDLREVDAVVQSGEKTSAIYLALALQNEGVKARSLDALQLRIQTKGNFQKAQITDFKISRIYDEFKNYDVLVVTGFQGIHEKEKDTIVTLGRGGSDLTAVALAARLGCPCQFFKKGAGTVQVFNPSFDKRAKKIKRMTYDQAILMTEYGYEFLMTRCLEVAKRFGVPLEFKSTPGFNEDPFAPGTVIDYGPRNLIEGGEEVFTAIATKENLAVITIENIPNIPGWGNRLYKKLEGKPFLDSSQFRTKDKAVMAIVTEGKEEKEIFNNLSKLKEEEPSAGITLSSLSGLSMITFIDSRIKSESSFFKDITAILAKADINIEYQSSSGKTIHNMIKKEDTKKAVLALAEKFDLLEK